MTNDEHMNLSRRITSADELAIMDDEQLRSLLAQHETEILSLAGRIEIGSDNERWLVAARQALRVLKQHKVWFELEIKGRKVSRQRLESRMAREAKAVAREAHRQAQAELQKARLARIAAANDANVKNIAVFKEVALEVLGAEMYAHLWELANRRMQPLAQGAAA